MAFHDVSAACISAPRVSCSLERLQTQTRTTSDTWEKYFDSYTSQKPCKSLALKKIIFRSFGFWPHCRFKPEKSFSKVPFKNTSTGGSWDEVQWQKVCLAGAVGLWVLSLALPHTSRASLKAAAAVALAPAGFLTSGHVERVCKHQSQAARLPVFWNPGMHRPPAPPVGWNQL